MMIRYTRHDSQRYSTLFNSESGFFARIQDPGEPEPLWSRDGPELLDISVTGWCDQGCTFCYRSSTTAGTHMSVDDFKYLMTEAERAGVLQVALGGGNPNQHPKFVELLRIAREEHGIVPSFTTNGKGLSAAVLAGAAKYCGGVAISAYAPYKTTARAVERLGGVGIAPNIHTVFSRQSIPQILEWLEQPPEWLERANALILLNYKPVGREAGALDLAKLDPRWRDVIRLATGKKRSFQIGFDSCCITGLLQEASAHPSSLEPCDAGRFSMFVSETMRAFPCSFMAELCEGHDVRSRGLLEVWRDGSLFRKFRERLVPASCGGRTDGQSCLGGCHLFPEINFCECGGDKAGVLDERGRLIQVSISTS